MLRSDCRRLWVAVLTAVTLAGCSGVFPSRQDKARDLAAAAGWEFRHLSAPLFSVAAAMAPAAYGAETLTVYLEGDGQAFLGPTRIASDPTPTDPTGLRLALAHPGPAVAYLARPCQYVTSPACGPAYWTSHRYSPAVVDAVGGALDSLKRLTGARRLVIVGYSGGGALAILVAARRSDVAGIVTVAANLDLALWTRSEGLSPLTGSLDPADHAAAVAQIPQAHLVGGRDKVVSAAVVRSFVDRVGAGGAASVIEKSDFGHECCWAEAWPRIARSIPLLNPSLP
jgi:pimeloyl-ACP methyl ester carboxylesterase